MITSNADGVFVKIRKSWAKNASRASTNDVMRVSEEIAGEMPDLGLPVMPAQARAAFRDVLTYEKPRGNGSVRDLLTFAQARGYVAHPCDWVPFAVSDFQDFLMRTRDMTVRAAYLHRVAEAGLGLPGRGVPDGEADLAQEAFEAALASEYPSTVFDGLGGKAGTLDAATVRRISHFRRFVSSITEELETGTLPVNIQYDPLRIVAFIASKDAAAELLQEALDIGIAPDNPRLTMLKFNLAL